MSDPGPNGARFFLDTLGQEGVDVLFGLTGSQFLDVLDLVRRGLSNAQIGERLYISPNTAERHVSSILDKLGARTRAEARRAVNRKIGAADGVIPRFGIQRSEPRCAYEHHKR